MCGIVGYTGKTACVPELLAGLESLAYRGYDSAGVAVYDGTEIQLAKAQGHLANLEALLKEHPIPGRCGIGHTRWATHGEPSYVNAHRIRTMQSRSRSFTTASSKTIKSSNRC